MIHKVIVPEHRSINVTLDIPQDYIGKEIEIVAFIKNEGFEKTNKPERLSPVLKGPRMTNEEFVDWIREAENSPTMSFDEMKERWAKSRNIVWEDLK